MVTVDRIHLKVGDFNPWFVVETLLEHGSNHVDWDLEEQILFIDRIKISETDQPVMFPTEDGEVPLIETVPFDKEVKGLLRMDFVLNTLDGNVSSAVLLLPEGVDGVLGSTISV